MEGIAIRELRPEDSEAIVFVTSYLAEHWHMTSEEVTEVYIRPSFLKNLPYIFIAFATDQKVAGMILLVLEAESYLGIKNELWITGLFVKEEFRKQGIARKLITIAEEKSRALGYRTLYLDTAQAAGYYRRIGGWEEIGTTRWEEQPEQELTIMKKELRN